MFLRLLPELDRGARIRYPAISPRHAFCFVCGLVAVIGRMDLTGLSRPDGLRPVRELLALEAIDSFARTLLPGRGRRFDDDFLNGVLKRLSRF